MTLALSLAVLVGLAVQGYVVLHVLALPAHAERIPLIAAVVAVPMPLTVIVWCVLRWADRRRRLDVGRTKPGRLRQAALLFVPVALGAAAVSAGETFSIGIRLVNAAIYTADDPSQAATEMASQANPMYLHLALAGLLLQLAVVALGFAFARWSRSSALQVGP